jgi:serine/threonine protein kinase
LITDQGRVKLTDFGIARMENELAAQAGGAASLSSISPEQYLGEALDIRSDLFALGCLLYRMLTGEHPFVRAGELDSVGLLEGTPQALEELAEQSMLVPTELSDLLRSLLQKRPDDRPGNTHQVRNTLREIARDIPLSVSNTLLQEAKVNFRRESEEDIPPVIPGDLTRNGRSSLRGSGRGFWPGFFVGQSAVQLMLTVLIASAIFLYTTLSRQVPVTLMAPSLNIATAAELPPEVSSHWLVSEIESTLAISTYKVDEAEITTYFSPGLNRDMKAGQVSERLRIHTNLHCTQELCLLGLVLEAGARRLTEQQMIITAMPIDQWSDLVRSATRDLLARNK